MALDIAVRYALQRSQFSAPDDENEVLIMDYLVHQRRLLPLVARSYALQFAQNELVARLHDLQTAEIPDAEEQRELESRAAGPQGRQHLACQRRDSGSAGGLRRRRATSPRTG